MQNPNELFDVVDAGDRVIGRATRRQVHARQLRHRAVHVLVFDMMGRLFVQSINARDYSMIMGTTLIYAVLIAFANLAVDVVYGWLDPRISYS